MNKENRMFFTALNTFEKIIDINKLNLKDIIGAYDKLARECNNFMERQNDILEKEKTKQLKRFYDRLYLYWIDPFNIALRNEIGATGIPKIDVEIRENTSKDRVILSEETIKKIRKKYNLDVEKETYNINSVDELIKILKDLINGRNDNKDKKIKNENQIIEDSQIEPYKMNSAISEQYRINFPEEFMKLIEKQFVGRENVSQRDTEFRILTGPIRKVETYSYTAGAGNVKQSFVNKYEISFEYDGKRCSKEIYGVIDLIRFYNNNMYKRVVLEAIEDLGIQNYRNRKNDKYIGSFSSYVKDGIMQWNQDLMQEELDAIDKIEKVDEMAKQEKMQRENNGGVR